MRRDKDHLLPDLVDGGSGGDLPALAQDSHDEDGDLDNLKFHHETDADSNSEGAPKHPYSKFLVKDSCSSKGLAIVDSEADCEQAAAALGFPTAGRTIKVRQIATTRPAGCYLYTWGGRIRKLEFNRKLTSSWTSTQWRDMYQICKKATMVKWSQFPAKCLAVINNAFLGIFDCNENDPNQQFVVPPFGKGPLKWVKQLGKCVGLSGGRTARGTHFTIATCNGRADQEFEFPSPGKDGLIKQKTSNRCVDVAAGRNVNKNKMHLWDCSATNVNQVFTNPSALPAVPFPISCHTTGQRLEQEKLVVTCPSGCQTANDWTWGSGVYRVNSAICRAGIHAGVITNAGGTLLYERKGFKHSFAPKQAHGVISKRGTASRQSFTVKESAGGAAAGGADEASEEEPEEEDQVETTEEAEETTEPPTTTTDEPVKVAAPVPAPAEPEEPAPTEAPATTTAAPEKKKGSAKMLAGIVGGIILLGGIGAGVYYARKRAEAKKKAMGGMFDDVAAEAFEGEWGEDEWHEDEYGAEGAGEGGGGEGEHHEEQPESGY